MTVCPGPALFLANSELQSHLRRPIYWQFCLNIKFNCPQSSLGWKDDAKAYLRQNQFSMFNIQFVSLAPNAKSLFHAQQYLTTRTRKTTFRQTVLEERTSRSAQSSCECDAQGGSWPLRVPPGTYRTRCKAMRQDLDIPTELPCTKILFGFNNMVLLPKETSHNNTRKVNLILLGPPKRTCTRKNLILRLLSKSRAHSWRVWGI